MSVGAIALELLCLRLLMQSTSPMLVTVASGIMTMQVMLGAASVVFGVLWFRALSRVRSAVAHRHAVICRVSARLSEADDASRARVVQGVAALQRRVRLLREMMVRQRLFVMESFEFASPARRQMLLGINALVCVYLVVCVYAICLYGT